MAHIPASPPRPRTVAACLLLAATVLAAGCVQSQSATPTSAAASDRTAAAAASPVDPADEAAGTDDMESRLVDLTAAADASAFADAHAIDYDDGRVSVVATLRDGASLPAGHDAEVTLAAGETVQASVPVDELRGLAAHENVTYVRLPREPNA